MLPKQPVQHAISVYLCVCPLYTIIMVPNTDPNWGQIHQTLQNNWWYEHLSYDIRGISRQVKYLCLVGKYLSQHHANLCIATQRLSDTARKARNAKYVLHHCGNARPFCENIENSNDRCLDWSDQQKIHNECNVDHAPHDGCNTSCQHASGLSSRGGSISPSVSPSSPSRLTRYSSDTRINGGTLS